MTPSRTMTAGGVLAAALAIGAPSAAVAGTLPNPAADAISQCLTRYGLPPLPASTPVTDVTPASATLPAGTLPPGSLPAGSLPTPTLPAGTLPAVTLPPGTLPAGSLPAGALPGASPSTSGAPAVPTATAGVPLPTGDQAPALPLQGDSTLQCPGAVVNNTFYVAVVTVTNTTTTTTVAAPITAANGSITTSSSTPGAAPAAPLAAGSSGPAIGRPLRVARPAHRAPAPRVRRHVRARAHVLRVRLVAGSARAHP